MRSLPPRSIPTFSVGELARDEGRQVQTLVEKALVDLVEKRRQGKPCPNVMAVYQGATTNSARSMRSWRSDGVLLVAEVLAIHGDQIARYGGSQDLRHPDLLEAALFRPQTAYYADLIEEAAAL